MNEKNEKQVALFLREYTKLDEIKSDNEELYNYYESKNKSLFKCLRSTRNILSHKTLNMQYPIFVNDILIEQLDKILKDIEAKVIDKAIRIQNMYTAKLDSNLLEVLDTMENKNYSYVPILNNDSKLLGVLTENTLLSYIANNKTGIIIDKDNTIEIFEKFISINKSRNESFEFVSRNTNMIEVENMFIKSISEVKRLSVVFITQNGLNSEKILGMVTAWDILGKE